MSTVFTGDDTITLDSLPVNDLGTGTVATLDFAGDITTCKTGKNGNSIFALNMTGKVATFELRVLKGSSDDERINARINQMLNSPSTFVGFTGSFVKKLGDLTGNFKTETYNLSFGTAQKLPGSTSDLEGKTEQGETVYKFIFANAPRILG